MRILSREMGFNLDIARASAKEPDGRAYSESLECAIDLAYKRVCVIPRKRHTELYYSRYPWRDARAVERVLRSARAL